MTQPLAQTLHDAIAAARARIGDPLASIAFVTSSRANGEQVRRLLGGHGPFIHVDFLTANQLVVQIGQLPLLARGRVPEPADWLGALLGELVPRLAEEGRLSGYGGTLCEPGWRGPLERALGELSAAGVDGGTLRELADGSSMGRRFGILATLMEEVGAARAQGEIYAKREVEEVALERIRRRDPHPLQEVAGVIVAGDALLPPRVFEATRAWMGQRDVTRLDLPPLCHLPPAPMGLREAAGEGCCVVEGPIGSGSLGHLRANLWRGEMRSCEEADDSVVLVSTPDEIREMDEVVRRVQRAIAEGTALDRIAVVLPDADQAHVLERALRKASIPATWMTGPSLARTGAATFLTLALALASGQGGRRRWYDLLTMPGVRTLGWTGRTRWRGLLARCEAKDGAGLVEELGRQAEEAEAAEDAPKARAARALAEIVGQLAEALAALPQEATLGEHGRAWGALMDRFWASEQDQQRVARVLEAWEPGGVGVRLTLEAAAGLLAESLHKAPLLTGSLTEPKIRVLPPMLLLGGAFDLVCLTGMTEGRFPRPMAEDVLLTDAMIARLSERGAPLVSVDDREQVERRRLAAVVAGCRGTLWAASPKFEMLEGRPCLPSSLLLTLASTLEGRRVSYRELGQIMIRRGSRSQPVPRTPEDALGAGEFLLARVIRQPAATLPTLATHATARRLMQLQRSVDRLEREEAVDAWTGLVPPESLPEDLETLELDAWRLSQWVFDPSAFFFEHVLGVYAPRRLASRDGMNRWALARAVMATVKDAMGESEETFDERFDAAWEGRVGGWVESGELDAASAEVWSRLGRREVDRMVAARGGPPGGEPAAVEGAPVHDSLPVHLTHEAGWADGETLVDLWRGKADAPRAHKEQWFRLLVQARAMTRAGTPIETLSVTGKGGTHRQVEVAGYAEDVDRLLEEAHRRTQAGWWAPSEGLSRYGLAREGGWKRRDINARVETMLQEDE